MNRARQSYGWVILAQRPGQTRIPIIHRTKPLKSLHPKRMSEKNALKRLVSINMSCAENMPFIIRLASARRCWAPPVSVASIPELGPGSRRKKRPLCFAYVFKYQTTVTYMLTYD